MASSDLREELNCSICLSIYTDPVTLKCGHNFCQACIEDVLDTQMEAGVYTCPECRKRFCNRPAPKKNLKLRNIVEHFSTQSKKKTRIFCTYCIHSSVPAVKGCLHCEAYLCNKHLRVHHKSEEHILTEPTTSWSNRKCPIHKELLKYYCSQDSVCICVSCSLAGEHRGHQVELLNEASAKGKDELRNVLEKLTTMREETEKMIWSLQENRREVQEKADGATKRVPAVFGNIRKDLEVLEKQVVSDIARQKKEVLLQISDLMKQMEKERDDLSQKMCHIEELCNMTDPLPLLQEKSQSSNFCVAVKDSNEDTQRRDTQVTTVADLFEILISEKLYRGLTNIVTGIKNKRGLYVKEASDVLVDINTANNNLTVSDNMKIISYSQTYHQRPLTPERFMDSCQVLSTSDFSSGRHFWKVEISQSGEWRLGVSYSNIERMGYQSTFGQNNKSWCLCKNNTYTKDLSVFHDSVESLLPHKHCQRLIIFLDYEAGRLSFYEFCDPIRHLHTFSATFTEPLHAAFNVSQGCWVRIIG
ncbi:E3 ubiquitin/ISG15 ligase TRIM25-like [Discoglossus pictus]